MALEWRHPFSAIIAGPSMCGKTTFVLRLIDQSQLVIQPPPQKIIFSYSVYQKAYKNVKNVEFRDVIPDMSELEANTMPMLLILDDQMGKNEDLIEQIFTKLSHHNNISVVYLIQNFFHQSPQQRTISLNASYIVLFKSVRDANQIVYLAKQMYGTKYKHLVDAFRDATRLPYTYIFIDLKPDTDDKHRIRANVFLNETNYVYLPK